MCGRYVSPDEASIEREFNLVHMEWQTQVDGKTRIPYTIHLNDQDIFAFAGREAWLTGSSDEAWATLKPYPDEHMAAWPVATRVNKPANNDAHLIDPAPAPV